MKLNLVLSLTCICILTTSPAFAQKMHNDPYEIIKGASVLIEQNFLSTSIIPGSQILRRSYNPLQYLILLYNVGLTENEVTIRVMEFNYRDESGRIKKGKSVLYSKRAPPAFGKDEECMEVDVLRTILDGKTVNSSFSDTPIAEFCKDNFGLPSQLN